MGADGRVAVRRLLFLTSLQQPASRSVSFDVAFSLLIPTICDNQFVNSYQSLPVAHGGRSSARPRSRNPRGGRRAGWRRGCTPGRGRRVLTRLRGRRAGLPRALAEGLQTTLVVGSCRPGRCSLLLYVLCRVCSTNCS